MPELPEVQTTTEGVRRTIVGKKIVGIWSDYHLKTNKEYQQEKEHIKNVRHFKKFKNDAIGRKVIDVKRRGKNILINLSGGKTIWVHLKMTGHLLYGKYQKEKGVWKTSKAGPLEDPFNQFIRLVFSLSNGKHLVLSDVRRFARVSLLQTDKISKTVGLSDLGPEPLEKNFTFKKFGERLEKRPRAKIKQVLLDQKIIAGIGNIYSDEVLFDTGIHPERITERLSTKEMTKIYSSIKKTLRKGLFFGGDSDSDYRNINGEKGSFQNFHKVYGRAGKPCLKRKCGGTIKRIVVGGRSAHFCPKCQPR